MKKKVLTAEDCIKLAKQNKNNEVRSKFWKLLAKIAINNKDKTIRDEQEKQEISKCLTDEGENAISLALKGDVASQFLLGEEYYYKDNFKEAFRWFWLAAQNGHAEAAAYLSTMYANGEYVHSNYDLSFQWCKIAANRGDKESKESLENIKKVGLN